MSFTFLGTLHLPFEAVKGKEGQKLHFDLDGHGQQKLRPDDRRIMIGRIILKNHPNVGRVPSFDFGS